MIETETEEDLSKIIGNSSLDECGMSVTVSDKRLPRVLVNGVPSAFSGDEVKEAIFAQNGELFDFFGEKEEEKREKFNLGLTMWFKVGTRGMDTTGWVIEVSPELRNILRGSGKLYIGSYRFGVADFMMVSRCYRCQGLGHIAKWCREELPCCRVCGERKHETKACKAKKVEKFCALFKRLGKSVHKHSPDLKCPIYVSAVEVLKERTDYG